MRASAQRFLHADAAGCLIPAPKMTPAELGPSLSADVLRLPYPPATRLVLAEIVSLHAATGGRCDCSDAHLAARLSISKDTASVAVQLLERDGLVAKQTARLPTGFYRTLTPIAAAIAEKAASNPYPENPATRKMPVAYPEIPGSPTRNMPVALPGNSGSNIPFSITSNFHQSSTTTPFGRGAAPDGPEKVDELPQAEEPAVVEVVEAAPAETPAPAPQKKVAAKKKPPERPARPSRPDTAFADSELADFPAFETALAGTDYELADLRYYHEKIKNWRDRKTGEPPLRKDWLATSKQFFLNDVRENCLRLAPGVQRFDPAGHPEPVAGGAGPTGYRSARHDR